MINHKWINIVCIVITVLTLAFTGVLMNAEKLGLKAAAEEENTLSEEDADPSWDESSAVVIDFDDPLSVKASSNLFVDGNLYIVTGNTYVLSGTLTEQQIIVELTSGSARIVLNGLEITNSGGPAIQVNAAQKVILTLAEGSENAIYVSDLDSEEAVAADLDAAVYAKSDLTVNGAGSLTVTASAGHGIKSTGDLMITDGALTVNAEGNALMGKTSVQISGGTFDLTAGNDGIKSKDEDGCILISGGDFTITAAHDGIQAEADLTVSGGTFAITTGDGSENGAAHTEEMMGGFGGFGGGRGRGMWDADAGSTDGTSENDSLSDGSQMPEMPTDGEMPEMGERPEMPADGEMPEMGELPEMPTDSEMPEMGEMPGESADSGLTEETGAEGETTEEESDSYKGLKAGGTITLSGGSITLNSADDAVHADTVIIKDGTLEIATGDDAIHADDTVEIRGGDVLITESYEGIEGYYINVYDGNLSVTASDDGMNAGGGSSTNAFFGNAMGGGRTARGDATAQGATAAQENAASQEEAAPDQTTSEAESSEKSLQCLAIYGGNVYVNAGGDGLDSNGDLQIYGGTVIVDGPSDSGNGSLDSGTESGGELVISGGTVLALGSSGMMESFGEDSAQVSFAVVLEGSYAAGDTITVTDESGAELFTHTAAKSGNSVVFSSPDLQTGQTVTVTAGSMSTEVTLSAITNGEGTSFGGFSSGQGFGGRGHQG
ncbi:MAG: carbohydrate-binding domain-containing protein [Lachnospiraceae bacterium]|nr:carbohydrate-binding domain-containing protein [Lachnospiraceae bacterium]